MLKFKATQNADAGLARLTISCPHCGHDGTLETIGKTDIRFGAGDDIRTCGQRACPNPKCRGHLFVIYRGSIILQTYPGRRIPFDPQNIPESIVSTFEEALDVYSMGHNTSAAIMIRRTLEELCKAQEATGKDLKTRLKDLRSKVVLPEELLLALDDLRLLGNDAAHVEAKTFSQVSAAELDVAIEFTKEVLKGLYQYSSLLSRLKALKKKDAA